MPGWARQPWEYCLQPAGRGAGKPSTTSGASGQKKTLCHTVYLGVTGFSGKWANTVLSASSRKAFSQAHNFVSNPGNLMPINYPYNLDLSAPSLRTDFRFRWVAKRGSISFLPLVYLGKEHLAPVILNSLKCQQLAHITTSLFYSWQWLGYALLCPPFGSVFFVAIGINKVIWGEEGHNFLCLPLTSLSIILETKGWLWVTYSTS